MGRSGKGVGGAIVWRTMAAEETQLMVSGGGATTALTTITKKSTNGRQQRRRVLTASKRRGMVVEVEEQLLYGGGARLHGKVMEAGVGRTVQQGVHNFFLFLAGFNPTSILPSTILNKNRGNFLISGVLFATI